MALNFSLEDLIISSFSCCRAWISCAESGFLDFKASKAALRSACSTATVSTANSGQLAGANIFWNVVVSLMVFDSLMISTVSRRSVPATWRRSICFEKKLSATFWKSGPHPCMWYNAGQILSGFPLVVSYRRRFCVRGNASDYSMQLFHALFQCRTSVLFCMHYNYAIAGLCMVTR